MQQITLRDSWGNLAMTISCKAIVFEDDKIWLRKNERGDWELPGGRLDSGEQPEDAVAREICEELGVLISEPKIIDAYVWEKDFGTSTHVELVTFRADVVKRISGVERVGEAGESEFMRVTVVEALELERLSQPYKRALSKL